MPILIAVIAALGGLAFWRRDKLGEDAHRLTSSASQTVRDLRSGRKDMLVELGERTYAKSTGDEDPDNEAEISRLIGELVQLDASAKDKDNGETKDEEPAVQVETSV